MGRNVMREKERERESQFLINQVLIQKMKYRAYRRIVILYDDI